jgi:hypothetical protein
MAQRDQYPTRGALGSAREAFAITPAAADLPQVPRALWVGVAGHLNLVFAPGSDPVVLKNVPVGLYPLSPTQVLTITGTATDIVGLV